MKRRIRDGSLPSVVIGGGQGLVVPAGRPDGVHFDKHVPGRAMRKVLRELGLA